MHELGYGFHPLAMCESGALRSYFRLVALFRCEYTKEISMFLALFMILLVMWLVGFLAFHVAGGLIHLLLIVAVISLVMHFFRRPSAA